MYETLETINKKLDENTTKLAVIQLKLDKLAYAPQRNDVSSNLQMRTIAYIALGLFLHAILVWIFTRK